MSERSDIATLSVVERRAVEVGILDADSGWFVSNHEDGLRAKLVRLSRAISGQRRRPLLADTKLELVREFACRTHRQHRPAEQLIPILMKEGYGLNQIAAFAALAA